MEMGVRHDGFCDPLARTPRRHDAVWVIVDRLMKSAHFPSVRITSTLRGFCRLYIQGVVRLHGVLVSIVSERDSRLRHTFGRVSKRLRGHG